MKSIRSGGFACAVGCALALHLSTAAAAPTEKILYDFSGQPDGQWPYANLINVKGELYGTTRSGGTHDDGTVFVLDRKTGAETVLYSFCSQQNCADGGLPQDNLVDVNGTLYGTAWVGGDSGCNGNGCGTVFALDPTTGVLTVLHTFGNGSDGQRPVAALIKANGKLYGTTSEGGIDNCDDYSGSGCGTVFSIDLKTGTETTVYSFCSQGGGSCTDGMWPYASLIDVNGTLYGTTLEGGAYGYGEVFSLDPTTGAETVVYSFCSDKGSCSDGYDPSANLIDVNGTLYGTTSGGGANGDGEVFAVDPATGVEMVLYSFCGQQNCTDGSQPAEGVIDANGTLYGTTYVGGADNGGTVFSLNPTTGAEQVVYSFCSQQNCTDGQNPYGSPIYAKGKLYGTTVQGGTNNNGTVFELKHP